MTAIAAVTVLVAIYMTMHALAALSHRLEHRITKEPS